MGNNRAAMRSPLNILIFVPLIAGQCEDTFPDGTACGAGDSILKPDMDSCWKYYECDDGCVKHVTCEEDPYSCVKYWNCQGSTATHFQCPDGLMAKVDEPSGVQCDFPDRVNCGNRPPCNECDDDCP